jgi:methylenetetrahydrofolate reductase (NADPH)
VSIPDAIVERMRKTLSQNKREEGKKICIEIIQQVMEIKGIAGIHMMAYKQAEAGAEILEEVGLAKEKEMMQ